MAFDTPKRLAYVQDNGQVKHVNVTPGSSDLALLVKQIKLDSGEDSAIYADNDVVFKRNDGSEIARISSTGDMSVAGNLIVEGTAISIDSESVNLSDNHLFLNAGYEYNVAQEGGIVVNYLPTTLQKFVDVGGFTAGSLGISNPAVAVSSAGSAFSEGDLVQISGAETGTNNGLFEVLSHVSDVLAIRGVGLTSCVEAFTQNQFTTDSSAQGTITKVNVAVLRASTDGTWQVGKGSSTPIDFSLSLVGPEGPAGADGATGPAGADGAAGAKGDQGDSGADGLSAYEVALENDPLIGTEAQWLASLVGAKGDTGDPGPQGDKGDQGNEGPQGPQGVAGPQGDQGVQGPAGNSFDLKGTKALIADLPSSGQEVGDAWVVTEDGGHLWVYSEALAWVDAGSIVGPQGLQGETGAQGPTGSQGPEGQKGDKGDPGDPQTPYSGTISSIGTASAGISAEYARGDHVHDGSLDDLDDVNAPAPSAGQVLAWSGTEWSPVTPFGGALTVYVDSENGVDAEGGGTLSAPYQSIAYAYTQVPSLGAPSNATYNAQVGQFITEKLIFRLAPGRYVGDVTLGFKRARVQLIGNGVQLVGNVKLSAVRADFPASSLEALKASFPAPWSGVSAQMTFEITGEAGGGVEADTTADPFVVTGFSTLAFEESAFAGSGLGSNWDNNYGQFNFYANKANIIGGMLIATSYTVPTTNGLPTSVIEIDSCTIGEASSTVRSYLGAVPYAYLAGRATWGTGTVGTTNKAPTGVITLKAHNSTFGAALGPRLTIGEIDGCRIYDIDRSMLGTVDNGAVTGSTSTSYIGMVVNQFRVYSGTGIPASQYRIGAATGTTRYKMDATSYTTLAFSRNSSGVLAARTLDVGGGVSFDFLDDSRSLAFTPTTSTNWSPAPTTVGGALDTLAAKAPGTVSGFTEATSAPAVGDLCFISSAKLTTLGNEQFKVIGVKSASGTVISSGVVVAKSHASASFTAGDEVIAGPAGTLITRSQVGSLLTTGHWIMPVGIALDSSASTGADVRILFSRGSAIQVP